MQNGSVIRAERQRGPDVWEFRWREPGADGKRKHRRMILGSIEQLADEAAARQAIATIRLDLNHGDAWLKTRSTAVSELAAHYRERELEPDTIWKTHSTKVTYEGYLNNLVPRQANGSRTGTGGAACLLSGRSSRAGPLHTWAALSYCIELGPEARISPHKRACIHAWITSCKPASQDR